MTESEWLACTNPMPMLEFLRGRASARKLRLFTCACASRNLQMMADEQFRYFVAVAEQFADGQAGEEVLVAAAEAAGDDLPDAYDAINDPLRNAHVEANATADGAYHFGSAPDEVRATQSNLIRDIFGNYIRSVTVGLVWLAWNDSAVVKLAQGIYDDRAFDCLPILAGALEEAGCDNADILAHCRGPGPHVRGCWVIDLLLNRS